ncbi:MAG: hypothetical protein H0V44_05075 [Planctomycetes bacterium]|nr:hypothetical protein [Planctomycetota bacterium]
MPTIMPAIRAFAVVALVAATAAAGDAPPADLKAQLKTTYAAVMKSGDLWSAIQLEWIAAAQKERIDLRGAPCLGGSDIYGDPTFASPDEVRQVADHGDSVAVLTSQRCHLYAPDGRPVDASVPYGIRGDAVDHAFDGGAIGVVTWYDNEKQIPDRWRARVVGCPAGNILFESDDVDGDESSIDGAAKVANDGSAVAFGIHRHGGNRHVIVVSGKGHKSIDGVMRVRGVGPMASWLVAEGADGMQTLIVGERRVHLRSSAVGPGLVAGIMEDGKAVIVDKAGNGDVLTLPMALGREPQVATVGRWLIVSSGEGARSLDNTNLLGESVGEAPVQPHTMAVFRWDDLAGDVHARALHTYENQLQVCPSMQAAAYLWHDKQVDLLDLSGKQPSIRTLARFPKIVDWVGGKRTGAIVVLRNSGWVVLDAAGQEVAADTVEGDPTPMHRSWALVRRGRLPERTYHLIKLVADPALRTSVQLKLPPDDWNIRFDPRRGRLCAEADRKWVEFDLSGEEVARGNNFNRPSNTYELPTWQEGTRFCWLNGRAMLKASFDDLGEAARLSPRDAWQVNRTVLILSRDERVLVSGKKKNEFIDLGVCAGADRIALRRDEPVFANGQNRIVATLAAGPSLAIDAGAKSDADAPALGPWRIEGMQFSPPHSGTLEWDERAGFVPYRLRSPRNNDPVGMVLVTASLVINLDPAAARLVGKKR